MERTELRSQMVKEHAMRGKSITVEEQNKDGLADANNHRIQDRVTCAMKPTLGQIWPRPRLMVF